MNLPASNQTVKTLVVSSNSAVRRILQHYLQKDPQRLYELSFENQAPLAVQTFFQQSFDLVIIGADCDGGGPVAFLEKLQLHDQASDHLFYPVIYVHSGGEFQRSLEALHQGAQVSLTVEELTSEILHLNIKKVLQTQAVYRHNQEMTAEFQRSNEELNHFAFAVSHDLRAPMRKIKSFGEILLETAGETLPEMGQVYLQRIVESAQKSMDMMQGLLRYSQVSLQNDLKSWVDLDGVVSEVLQELSVSIQERQAEIIVGKIGVEVYGETSKLRQLVQNLVENALKYGREDAPIQIAILAQESADQRLVVSVADNGIGFSASEGKYIFDLFQRLPGGASSPGQGIGLAICKRIIEDIQGKIRVESEVDVGTTFYLEFVKYQIKDQA